MINGYWGTFKGVKCLRCDSYQAPPSTIKVGIISLLRTYTSMMWTGINVVVLVVIVVVVLVSQLHRRIWHTTATVCCTNYIQVSFYTISFVLFCFNMKIYTTQFYAVIFG